MSASELQAALQRAVHAGLLPADTEAPVEDNRPWPVVLLIALGAWLAALPLLGVLGLLLGDFIERGAGLYLIGVLLLAGAVVVLRSRQLPVFVEQLALPALLVGGLSLGAGLFRDTSLPTAAAGLSVLSLAVAAVVPRSWLRVLLGTAAAAAFCVANMPRAWDAWFFGSHSRIWLTLHLMLALWLAAGGAQSRLQPRVRALLEPLRAGWLLATLAGLALASGMTMLAGASLGAGAAGDLARMPWQSGRPLTWSLQGLSLLLTLAAAAWAARQWPALRQPWSAAAAAVLAALAALMPALGASLLALSLTASASRWRLAGAAALAAAWIVGAFYYALSWPLQDKALALVAAGALLGGLAWWGWQGQRAVASAGAAPPAFGPRPRIGIALCTLAVLAVANVGIRQKERLIAQGQPVFIELAPVDPRSLMQGDYMALRFAIPSDVTMPAPGLLQATRPVVLVRRDARGVATLHARPAGAALQAGELLMELTPKNGDWVLVTDAWFFAEGQAERWAAARYGEFRVNRNGQALLVGLRGAALQPL